MIVAGNPILAEGDVVDWSIAWDGLGTSTISSTTVALTAESTGLELSPMGSPLPATVGLVTTLWVRATTEGGSGDVLVSVVTSGGVTLNRALHYRVQ